jgi:DNA-binding response OmpR family regulator
LASEAAARARPLHGKRVLLAEDDDSARRIMAGALRAMGAEVIEAADGGRMLVAIASYYKDGRSPSDLDLVVTDVRMPVVGGLDIFQSLRAARWTTPVIVVTAYESSDVRDAARSLGAVVLTKPLDLEELERTARRVLAEPRRGDVGGAKASVR